MTTADAWAQRDLLWAKTNSLVDAGKLTREAWAEHLRAEAALAKQDDTIDLEAAINLGLRQGFAKSIDDVAAVLRSA